MKDAKLVSIQRRLLNGYNYEYEDLTKEEKLESLSNISMFNLIENIEERMSNWNYLNCGVFYKEIVDFKELKMCINDLTSVEVEDKIINSNIFLEIEDYFNNLGYSTSTNYYNSFGNILFVVYLNDKHFENWLTKTKFKIEDLII